MDTTTTSTPKGGFYAGRICLDGKDYALIVAPKEGGEHDDAPWNENAQQIEGALSYDDGLANTQAMAAAGSALAQWAQGLTLGGFSDWYLPSQDELEVVYRNLKPAGGENFCYARSGINLSSQPPARPYTPESPSQTAAEPFRAGSCEALDDEAWYWSSTQHAANPDYAWAQLFGGGHQNDFHKVLKLRARAVRRSAI